MKSTSDQEAPARRNAAQRWEAFYQRELRDVASRVRAGRLTAEAVDEASAGHRLIRARRAVETLRVERGPNDARTDQTRLRSAVRADLAHVIAQPRR